MIFTFISFVKVRILRILFEGCLVHVLWNTVFKFDFFVRISFLFFETCVAGGCRRGTEAGRSLAVACHWRYIKMHDCDVSRLCNCD